MLCPSARHFICCLYVHPGRYSRTSRVPSNGTQAHTLGIGYLSANFPSDLNGIRMKEIKCAFSLQPLRLKKCIFSCCFIQNWEKIESLKKVLE